MKSQPVPLLRLNVGAEDKRLTPQDSVHGTQSPRVIPSKLLNSSGADEAAEPLMASMSYEEERSKRVLYADPDLHLSVSFVDSLASLSSL